MATINIPENSKHLCQGNVDRISNLPRELLLHILQLLPLRDAVRTSVLSRYWNRQWVSRPRLIFDWRFFRDFLRGRAETCDICLDYMLIVNDMLFSHVGFLSKFVLYIPRLFPKSVVIDQWLRYICAKSVNDVLIQDDRDERTKTNLPTCLFSCLDLTSLTLAKCKLPSLPVTFRGFPCLVMLNLVKCVPSANNSNMLGILISNCPELRNLTINSIRHFQSDLTICAPKLKKLYVGGDISNLCLEGTSKIRTCHLLVNCENWYRSSNLTDYFTSLANVEHLILRKSFWKVTLHNNFTPPKKLHKQLEQLKSLHLVNVPLDCSNTMSFIVLCLFESCPHLEQLCVVAVDYIDHEVDRLPQYYNSCSLQCLKNVLFSSRVFKSHELQFIKFLLACSPVLEKMTICTARGETEENFNLSSKLLQYARASRKAQIALRTSASCSLHKCLE